jgi:DNA-binding winged helix-turn-helix (wHTH) protein/tetratricopeptide (TPR) repeat protein
MARERYRIADLVIDVGAVSVLRDGLPIALPQLSFGLLVALARRAPDVVTSDELIATVWAGLAVSDETLTQRAALLRRALGDEAKNPRYLRAVRGRGYQLVPAAVPLADEAPQPESRSRWKIAAMIAAVASIGAAGLLAPFHLVPGLAGHPAAESALATRPPTVPELLARAGDYLRRHRESDNELAIELYQRALQSEPRNPRALAGLSLAVGQRATKFNRSGGTSAEAAALARQALAIDPRLGQAHHALALALDSQGRITPALAAYGRAAALEPEASAALASAAHLLQVQGHLAAALEADLRAARAPGETPIYLEVQIGTTLALLGFDQASRIWFERAVELHPDSVFAAAAFAQARLSKGRAQEADAIAAQAIARGIRRPELPTLRGTVALLAGDAPRARRFFEEALAVAPGAGRARTRLLLLDGAPSTDRERRSSDLMQEIRRGRAAGDEWPAGALDEAFLAAGSGDRDAALRALDTAIDLGERDADWLLLDPALAGLRGDPGFVARIERIRRLVYTERQRVAGAPWLPPSFLDGSAARM